MTTGDDVLLGRDLFGDTRAPARAPLADRFGVPPFSVLDARSGDWQERKRAWAAMGIRGEVGRDGNLIAFSDGMSAAKGLPGQTSVFDPHLCELVYRWFSAPGAQVVDPFAGGSVRGIVAGALGRRYWGCDLRPEQIAANEAQADAIAVAERPRWVCGDALEEVPRAPDADLVFSCPPYGSLERYSDDERDLSAMDHHAFVAAYKRIIARSVERLKPDRFACFVVGDFRCSRGFYRNFVGDTVTAFEQAGAGLYNDAILLTPTGSSGMRATRQFAAGRKLCKTHQNVLVFCKGDPRRAADAAKEEQEATKP